MGAADGDEYRFNYEETELRLGLPGGSGNDGEISKNNSGKRGFSETVDLKLNLSSKNSHVNQVEKMKENNVSPPSTDPAKHPAKYVFLGDVLLLLRAHTQTQLCLHCMYKLLNNLLFQKFKFLKSI
ncbi:unnamed protein product [Ilex paraguariensis]|uniref:Uncharacterized protein n=1 Tax=Ilex paraguariensis TaxID=185542 RepID=A0ABC8SXF5_9AQUA